MKENNQERTSIHFARFSSSALIHLLCQQHISYLTKSKLNHCKLNVIQMHTCCQSHLC